MTDETTVTLEQTQTKAGKYLTFALADEEYGLEILKVREIIGMMEITSVPRTPPYVKGVINLRGKVIPVVDLRLKVGMAEAKRTDETCIIVVDIGEVEMGIIVDRVLEVLDVAGKDIEDPPSFGSQVNTDYILGMGKLNDRVTILLDISKLLTQADMSAIEGATLSTQGESSTQSEDEGEEQQEQPAPESSEQEGPAPEGEQPQGE